MTATEARPGGRRFTGWADTWRFPVLVFLAALVVLMPVVQISHDHLSPEHPQTAPDISDADRYGGWMQFDTGWYVYVAEHGYDQHQVDEFKAGRMSAVAYFPAYPLTVRQVGRLTSDDYVLAAELTTAACGLAVMLLFWLWCGRHLSRSARRTTLLLYALYPYSWFLFGTGYGDALFITLTISAMLLVERDRPVLAGLVGAVASAARLIGVGTVIGLIAITLQRRQAIVRRDDDDPRHWWSGWRLDRSRLRRRDFEGKVPIFLFARPLPLDYRARDANDACHVRGWTAPGAWIITAAQPRHGPEDMDQVLVLRRSSSWQSRLRRPPPRPGTALPRVPCRHTPGLQTIRWRLRRVHRGHPCHPPHRQQLLHGLRPLPAGGVPGVRRWWGAPRRPLAGPSSRARR